MNMGSQIRESLLVNDKRVNGAMVRLTAAVLLGAALPGCVMVAGTDAFPRIRERVLKEYAPTSRPTTQPVEGPITLPEAIEIALANNPQLAAARYDVDAASADRDMALGELLPKINLEGGYTYYREDRLIKPRRPGTVEVLGFTDQLVTGDIVLTMPLFRGGRLVNQIKAAELITESAKQELLHSRTELVFNVSSVFYSMLGQRKVIESLIFSRKALREHQKIVAELLDAQKAAKVDLLRTEVRLANIEQELIRARNVLSIKRFLLASLLGLSRQKEPLDIEGELVLIDVPPGLGQGLATALSSRLDYQSLKSRTDVQRRNLDIAKARRLPEVSLRASYGKRWDATSSFHGGRDTDVNEVGEVSVFGVIPVFEGGRIDARIRRERNRLRAQEEALRRLELQIQLEVETATSNIESTRARVGVTQKAVEQARESLRIEREKYNLAKGAIVDVLDAQSALLDSQMNYYRALADHNTAVSEFRLAVGEKQ